MNAPIRRPQRVTLRAPVRHHNLPALHTQLFGREQDRTRVRDLILQTPGRLLTLTGTGGCGKTQFALLVATSQIDSFPDGVWLVDLAPMHAAQLVPQTVVSALGVREQPNETPTQTLVSSIGGRRVLLVLDNCEHLLDACAQLAAALLDACPNLRLLTTSREPLRISGERVWRVPSLGVIEPHSMLLPDEVTQFSAVQLFVQRAQAIQPDFGVTPRNAAVVAAICARLGGLPLAIELAAAWVRVLGVDQILERLDDSFELLVGGSRSAPSRQQTMRATMDWSYGLLAEAERVVFERLAVFVGGWNLEAAESICSEKGVARREALSLLTRLVDASLVQVEERDGRARYRLLEPVRQYAHGCLSASGELDAVRRQHAAFFLSLAEQWETDANVGGPGRQAAHAVLEREQHNLRATLRWCLEQGEAEKGLSLGKAHWNFWVVRGLLTEGRAWLTQLAALPEAAKAPTLRANALNIVASLAFRQGNYATALEIYREVLPLLRQARDPFVLECALMDLAFIGMHQGDYQAAQTHWGESLAAARDAGHRINEALTLIGLGWVALLQAAYPTAREWCEEALAVARAVGDSWAVSISLNIFGHVLLRQGDLAAAKRLLEEGVALQRQIGERFVLAHCLDALGQVATAQGHYTEARAALSESLRLRHDMGDPSGMADTLESIAALSAAESQPERAVQLAGAAAALRETIGAQLSPMGRSVLDHWFVPIRHSRGEESTRQAWEAGRATSRDQATELALAATDAAPTELNRQPDPVGSHVRQLTRRERQVAALLADGFTNRQIAEQLVVTQRTVASHIEHILEKLGFASRHQVGVWAAERGLQAQIGAKHGLRSEVADSHRQVADLR